MQLQVEITSKDFHDFTSFLASEVKSRPALCMALNIAFFAAISYTAIHLFETGKELDYETADWMAGPGIIAALAGLWMVIRSRLPMHIFEPMPDRYVLGIKHFSFSESGIDVSGKRSNSHYQWDAIIRTAETADQFFLFLDANAALIIPKRTFESREDFEEFQRTVLDFRRMANGDDT